MVAGTIHGQIGSRICPGKRALIGQGGLSGIILPNEITGA